MTSLSSSRNHVHRPRRKQTVRLKIDFLRWILGSGADPARESMLVEFVETYLPLNKTEQRQFDKIVLADPENEELKKMVNVYEQ